MPYFSAELQYLLVNAAIGVGIAADAVIATIGRFRRFNRAADALAWAAAIGFTHTVFPTIGLIGLWYAASFFPSLKAGIYGAGSLVMIWFITGVVREAAGLTEEPEESEGAGGIFYEFLAKHSGFWAAVWAVSIDALVTGPGKTAATAQWTQMQVLGSFPLVGSVVFGLVLLSAWPALLLRKYWCSNQISDPRGLAYFTTIGAWIEISIFLYFAFLALLEMARALGILTAIDEFLLAGALCALVTLLLLWAMGGRVWGNQLQEAENLLDL